jgi:hypothetical protein
MIHRTFISCSLSLGIRALVALMTISAAAAELPSARLDAVFPPGAKQGSTVEVTITGQDLHDVTALHFSDARITARPTSASNRFAVTVAADAPVGIYDVRAIGRYGVSNPRSFVVGSHAESISKPGNTTKEKAPQVSIKETISATAQANAINN